MLIMAAPSQAHAVRKGLCSPLFNPTPAGSFVFLLTCPHGCFCGRPAERFAFVAIAAAECRSV